MHILMLLDHNYPPDQRVENEVESLVKEGFEVTVLSIGKDERPKYEENDGWKVIRINMPIWLLKKLRGAVGFVNVYCHLLYRYIRKAHKIKPFDAIHVHDLYLAKAGILTKEKFKVPLVIDLHENYVDALSQYAWSTRPPGKWIISIKKWKQLEVDWLKKADMIITVIKEMKLRYINIGFLENNLIVTPNTPNISAFRSFPYKENIQSKFPNRKVILYSGGFDLHRGLETAVKAMGIVCETNPDALLVLVGSGRNKPELERLVTELNISENVVFEGWQDQSNIRSYVKRADIGLIPHVKSVQTDASIPHKLGYYMSEELPIITSNCISLERMVSEYKAGRIFESENEKDLATQIQYLLDNPIEAKAFAMNGKNAAEKEFNWDYTIQPMLDYYKDLRQPN